MRMRIGKVTNIYPSTGRVKVVYEDENSSSLQLAMLTMNQEYSMPSVGDRVVTMHMENGSSKGFVLGTYYGGGMQPRATSGYRKDFTSGAYVTCIGGRYRLKGSSVNISGSGASVSLGANASMVGTEVVIGCAASSESETSEVEPDVYLKITSEEAELKSAQTVKVIADGGAVEVTANGESAKFALDTDTILEATSVTIKADDITLECSYGTITVEDMMKRLERIEDQLGLPHTI